MSTTARCGASTARAWISPLYHLQGLVGGIHGNKDTAEMVYNQLVWMSQNKAEQ